MSSENEQTQIEKLTFDGVEYLIDDLTPAVKEGFNALLKIQQNLNELAQHTIIMQSAQKEMSKMIKKQIVEDDISPISEEAEVVEPEEKD